MSPNDKACAVFEHALLAQPANCHWMETKKANSQHGQVYNPVLMTCCLKKPLLPQDSSVCWYCGCAL